MSRQYRDEATFIEDDFDEMEQFGRDARGGLPKDGTSPLLTEWRKLSMGKTLGKSIILHVPGVPISNLHPAFAPNNVLEVSGDDTDALNLSLLLSPPKVLDSAGLTVTNVQNVSGTQDNINLFANPPPAVPFIFLPVVARVEWGIGGTSNQVDIDVSDGTVVNISSSFVRVSMGIDVSYLAGGFFSNTPGFYQLSAFIGPGFGRGSGCRRTFFVRGPVAHPAFLANNETSEVMPIPRFAKKVSVIGSVASGNTWAGHVRFFTSNNALVNIGDVIVQANLAEPFLIPNGAYYFTVLNISGVDATPVAVFELAI